MEKRRSDKRNAWSQSLARGLRVLETIAGAPEVGIRELSRGLGLSLAITHRLVRTLMEHGFVEQNPDTRRYRVGVRAFQVGSRFLAHTGLSEAATPVLRAVAEKHEMNCYLGVLAQGRVIYLAAIQSPGPIVIRVRPGATAHLHSTALGKVLLASQPDLVARTLLGAGPLPKLTPKTVGSPKALIAELAGVRARGYAISDEENLPGVFAVGAPVRDATGRVTAAISVACPRYLVSDERIPDIARVALDASEEISRRLGFVGEARWVVEHPSAGSPEPLHRRSAAGAGRSRGRPDGGRARPRSQEEHGC